MFREIQNRNERQFAQSLDAEGKLWFWQPKTFRLDRARTYRPDFYVVPDGCFVEVISGRQAYNYHKENIKSFRRLYPEYELRVVEIDTPNNGGVQRKSGTTSEESSEDGGETQASLRTVKDLIGQEIRKRIDEAIREGCLTSKEIGSRTRTSTTTAWRHLKRLGYEKTHMGWSLRGG